MLNYANLSDVEFEYLCQDVMQKKLNTLLRRFAQGKDGGIDLTDDVSKLNIIVQVKHYNFSSIATLISSLKKEKKKLEVHKPKEYFICCSKNLTPENINELFTYFSEYMPSDKNILTLNEIDDFLQLPENQDVLNKHYKLWIDSVGLLQQAQNADVFIDCEVLLSNIEKEKKFFVKTQAYEQAVKSLNKNKTLFITGNPGVGKTITSKMLVLYYATLGYRVRYTTNTSNFRELKKSLSLDKNLKEIILVDDCFGQAYFKMHDAQNEDLLSLIKYVNLSHSKLLILNSRITIFQEAMVLKPDLVKSMEDNEYKTIVIDINAISNIEKANEADIDKTKNQFQSSLRRLTESFVSIVDEKREKKVMVANPSVNDYLDGRMEDNLLEQQAIVENAFSIQQIEKLPSDIIIDENFLDELTFGINGAEELIQYHFQEENDDDNESKHYFESAETEIDYIFNRKIS